MGTMTVEPNGTTPGPVSAGVIGVGTMGRHHARIYSELPGVSLVGVQDVDRAQAESVAAEYETTARSIDELLAVTDVVSVAVPTEYHYETVRRCLDADTHVLVEKPFVDDIERGHELAALADRRGLTLQVGHIERFNPATRVLSEIVPDLDVVGVDIKRLGPPVDRDGEDSVVMDLMIHDIDILLSIVDAEIDSISATARDEQHANVQFQFADQSVASLTASRRTQQKVRKLSVTAQSCRVNVDFIDQSVEIHRRSLPEYVEADGDIRYRHESVVERPIVENGEPLKGELSAFVEAVRTGDDPVVSAEDALQALSVVEEIEQSAFSRRMEVESV